MSLTLAQLRRKNRRFKILVYTAGTVLVLFIALAIWGAYAGPKHGIQCTERTMVAKGVYKCVEWHDYGP